MLENTGPHFWFGSNQLCDLEGTEQSMFLNYVYKVIEDPSWNCLPRLFSYEFLDRFTQNGLSGGRTRPKVLECCCL